MALRYLALASCPEQRSEDRVAELTRATGLTIAFTDDRFTVLATADDDVLILPGGRGVVIGHLFPKHGPPCRIQNLSVPVGVHSIAGNRQILLERHWGAYVAIFRSEDGIEILRDPSGGLPCYYLGDGDVLFFASDVDLFLQAKLYCPSVDWDDLAWQLYAAGLPSEFTALAGIRELQQGTVLNNECGAIRKEALWSPWAFASGDADLSDHEREEQLRRVVQNCISAWASAHRKILVGVSGGLDSSIVWSCASQTKALVEGITLATEDPSGDERVFARALFEADQAELHEAFFLLGDIDLGKSCAQHLPRPLGRSHELAYAKMVRRYLKGTSSDCFFTGNGGDNVFSYSQSAAAVTDRILAQGAGIGAFRTLIDICRMVGCNPLEAALNAGKAFRRRKSYIWQPDKLFLAKEVADASARRELTHPWLHAPSGSLPGKIGHVARLLRIQLHLEGFERTTTPPVINPLMSQPIVEECLGIQSWDWCSGGINRSVARRAFAKSLPPAILNRQSKSGPDSFCVELIERNRAEIRSRLLDGQLVGRGLINGSQLEGALAGEGLVRGSDYVRILSLLDTEAWITGWQERRTDSFPIG